MTGTNMTSLMDIIIIAAGVYLLYGWFQLKFENYITPGIMIPKDLDQSKCKDLEGFKSYMGLRTLITGLCSVVSGLLGIISAYVVKINPVIYWVMYFVFFAVLVWYMVASKKAQKNFF